MYCPNCGNRIEQRARYCPDCGSSIEETRDRPGEAAAGGEAVSGLGPREEIPNYLVQAILVTIFCCLPFGIVSIVYAAQVNGKVAGGDIRGARDASEKAKIWAWVALGCGLLPVLLFSFGVCGFLL